MVVTSKRTGKPQSWEIPSKIVIGGGKDSGIMHLFRITFNQVYNLVDRFRFGSGRSRRSRL